LIVVAGLVSGVLAGFIFRASDAERRHDITYGYRNRLMQALSAPIWTLEGLLLFIVMVSMLGLILWAPGAWLGVFPLYRKDFYYHKVALIVGVFIGWFLRWALWKKYLQYL